MKYPTVFVNHGGGPLPLMGKQAELVKNMQHVVKNVLPATPPSAIVVFSAHWESDNGVVLIASSTKPSMFYDYHGFPSETYEYKYPAPGDPQLAQRIHDLLSNAGIDSALDNQRGFDHGVFVPLMIMYPSANIPVVQVSLDASLDPKKNMDIGAALTALRDDNILILGSGATFHNMQAFFDPSRKAVQDSKNFNTWLKSVILLAPDDADDDDDDETTKTTEFAQQQQQRAKCYAKRMASLETWAQAPGARISHPREDHLMPLLMVAAAGGETAIPRLTYDTIQVSSNSIGVSAHAVTGYLFE